MKRMKRLFSLGIALVMVFGALSVGMVVHAEESPKVTDAFSFIKLNGKEIDLSANPDQATISGFTDSSATVDWTCKDGWDTRLANAYPLSGSFEDSSDIKSGESFSLKGDTMLTIGVGKDDGTWMNYYIYIHTGKPKLRGATYWAGATGFPICDNVSYDTKVVSVKSSKSDVISVKKGKTLDKCKFTAKKAGKSTITIELNLNGEKKKVKATYTVKKYPNALKTLKVDGKSVNFKKKPFEYSTKVSKDKVKVEFKAGSGWKFEGGAYFDVSAGKFVTIKSGSKVKVPKGKSVTVFLDMVNKKKEYFEYVVVLKR